MRKKKFTLACRQILTRGFRLSTQPPPLPFVLPVMPIMVMLLSCCVCVGIGAFIKAKKGGKTPQAKADVKAGEKDGDDGGSKETGPENGPKSFRQRGCTDIICLLFYGIFMVGMLYLFYLGCTVGDPYVVTNGKDYLGNRCGRGNFSDRPKVIFPRIGEDVLEQAAIASTAPWKLVFYGLCVKECPNVTDPTVCFGDPDSCMNFDYGEQAQWEAAGGSSFYYSVMPTVSVINRCIPIKNQREGGEVPRCAYPLCDNITNPWMVCDTEVTQAPSELDWRCLLAPCLFAAGLFPVLLLLAPERLHTIPQPSFGAAAAPAPVPNPVDSADGRAAWQVRDQIREPQRRHAGRAEAIVRSARASLKPRAAPTSSPPPWRGSTLLRGNRECTDRHCYAPAAPGRKVASASS